MIAKVNKLNLTSNLVNFFYDNKLFLSKSGTLRPAIFLDRDGVVIKEKHYISLRKDVELEYGVNKLFNLANSLNIAVIIITNQSGIARGLFKWDDYLEVTDEMLKKINQQNTLIAIFANGLNSEGPLHSWRKPSPLMIKNASFNLKIDLSKSIIIGDRLTDLISGLNAGIRNLIHIKTGYGISERKKIQMYFDNLDENVKKPFYINNFSDESLKFIEKFFKS